MQDAPKHVKVSGNEWDQMKSCKIRKDHHTTISGDGTSWIKYLESPPTSIHFYLRFVIGRMRGTVRKEDAIQNEVGVLFATAGSKVSTESVLTWIHFPRPKPGAEKLIS